MPTRKPDIGFIPTPPQVVDVILQLAELTPNDVVYDLGSGDGRILIAASQRYGVRGVGIDIDGDRIQKATQQAILAGVNHLIEFRQQDLYESNFRDATVVMLYLLPHLNLKLRPTLLEQLQPGSRILSHDFDLGDWQPDAAVQVAIEAGEVATVYRWLIEAAL
ncbi:MAG: class I SAM-dependent methyltransferase [Leptolyngbyaceae cyanobacterium bins.302]|nr:class I SAM-dependent methyltransferase [Leptolyngbyaceae cyanobacterium bins.302]